MKVQMSMILAVGLLVGASAFATQANDAELKKLEGTWQAVSAEDEGQQRPKEEVESNKMVITGNKIRWFRWSENSADESTFKVDSSKNPGTIDVDVPFLRDKLSLVGIYKVEGDKLTLVFRDSDCDPRPTEFKTAPGSRTLMAVFQRVKP